MAVGTRTMDEDKRRTKCLRSNIGGILILLVVLYVGAPVLLVAPSIWVTGDVPPGVEALFAPIDWLYQNSSAYGQFIDWQSEMILGI